MFEDIFKRINQFAQKCIKIIQQVLIKKDKVVTKKTFKSLRQSVDFNLNQNIDLDIYGDKSFEYIEKGRKPNSKAPPKGVLIDWMKELGIPLAKEYPIRIGIGKKGIQPVPIIELSFIEIRREFNENVSEDILKIVSSKLSDAVRKDFIFPNN